MFIFLHVYIKYVLVCVYVQTSKLPCVIHVHGTRGGQRSKSSVDSHRLHWLKQGLSQFTTVYRSLACLRGSRDFPILTLLLTTGIEENTEAYCNVQLCTCSLFPGFELMSSCFCDKYSVLSCLHSHIISHFVEVGLSHPDLAWTHLVAQVRLSFVTLMPRFPKSGDQPASVYQHTQIHPGS